MEMLFIFVEGPDDERFFDGILKEKVKIIKYAKEKKEKINSFIKSIKATPYLDYIVLCDIDLKTLQEKRKDVKSKYSECEMEKIFVSISEIESWYLAGLDKDCSKKFKIKYINKTNDITKEKFDAMIPKNYSNARISFMIEILKEFKIEEAIERNESFQYLISYLVNVKKMAVL